MQNDTSVFGMILPAIIFITLIQRKFRMLQIQGLKDYAVVVYCKSLITKEIGYHQLSRRANKMGFY
jgi:hypothetical protein